MANIPFLQIEPQNFEHEKIFRHNDNGKNLVMVILLQDKQDDKSEYTTEKLYLIKSNNSKLSSIHREEYKNHFCFLNNGHLAFQARLKNKFRRLNVLIIDKETLFMVCQNLIEDHKFSSFSDDGQVDLEEYAEVSFQISLKDISLAIKNEGKMGAGQALIKQDAMTISTGGKMQFYYKCSLIAPAGCDPALTQDYLETKIWSYDEGKTIIRQEKRGAVNEKRKKVIIKKRNHQFIEKYLPTPRACYVCQKQMWGLYKQKVAECSLCKLACHVDCIPKIIATCTCSAEDIYVAQNQMTSGQGGNLQGDNLTANIRVNVPHATSKKTNYSLRVFTAMRCSLTGKPIYPFRPYFCCKYCDKVFHHSVKVDQIPRDCGFDTSLIAVELEKIRESRKDDQLECSAADLIYGDASCVNQTSARDAMLEQAAAMNEKNDHHIFNENVRSQVQKKRRESIRKQKASGINDFILLKKLGEGSYGKVLLGHHRKAPREVRNSSALVAIKAIRKDVTLEDQDVEAIHIERDQMNNAYPFLAKMVCTFQDMKFVYFVLELCSGGTLLDYIINHCPRGVPLPTAKITILEILLGLRHLHKNRVIYRDLKLENVMFGADGHVRIIDFGMVRDFKIKQGPNNNDIASTFCGTPDYMAPEIISGKKYSYKVDVWAAFVCLFELIEGFSPFQGSTEKQLASEIQYKEPRFKYAKKLNDDESNKNAEYKLLKKMIASGLEKKPENRPSIEEILSDSSNNWFSTDQRTINPQSVEQLQFQGPIEIPPKDLNSIIKQNFESPDVNEVKLESPGDDVRMLTAPENAIFKDFDLQNHTLMRRYIF